MLSVFLPSQCLVRSPSSLRFERSGLSRVGAVGVAHGNHGGQHVAPGARVHHRRVRKHAAVPADVFERARRSSRFVSQPCASDAHDVHLAVRIMGQAVPPGLVVRARAFHRGIVLGDMKVDRPRSQCARHRVDGAVERLTIGPVDGIRKDAIFGRVVPEREQQRMRHVGLKTECAGAVHHLQQLDHPLPAVHAAPADFSFRREAFAVILGNRARLPECRRDAFRIS